MLISFNRCLASSDGMEITKEIIQQPFVFIAYTEQQLRRCNLVHHSLSAQCFHFPSFVVILQIDTIATENTVVGAYTHHLFWLTINSLLDTILVDSNKASSHNCLHATDRADLIVMEMTR